MWHWMWSLCEDNSDTLVSQWWSWYQIEKTWYPQTVNETTFWHIENLSFLVQDHQSSDKGLESSKQKQVMWHPLIMSFCIRETNLKCVSLIKESCNRHKGVTFLAWMTFLTLWRLKDKCDWGLSKTRMK